MKMCPADVSKSRLQLQQSPSIPKVAHTSLHLPSHHGRIPVVQQREEAQSLKSDTLDYRVSPTCQPILVAARSATLVCSDELGVLAWT